MSKSWIDGKESGDIIERGEIVKRAYQGKFGEILRAYINGAITRDLLYNQNNPTDRKPLDAERVLGRCEGYTNVLIDLERMIQECESLQAPQPIEEDNPNEGEGYGT